MNDYTLSHASRRDVTLDEFTATIAVGLPPGASAQPPTQDLLAHKHTKDVKP
jgi:hypothetical protein